MSEVAQAVSHFTQALEVLRGLAARAEHEDEPKVDGQPETPEPEKTGRRFLRKDEVRARLGGVPQSTFASWVSKGLFPKGRCLSSGWVVWDVETVDAFVANAPEQGAVRSRRGRPRKTG